MQARTLEERVSALEDTVAVLVNGAGNKRKTGKVL